MAFALVGSAGTVSTGATSASVTPSYGQTPVGNHLLVLWVAVNAVATNPSAPSGWTSARVHAGTSVATGIFYKIAAGGDATPTVAGIASAVLSCQLAEFSGGSISTANALDQIAATNGTTSPQSTSSGTVDLTSGELFIGCSAMFYSAAASKTLALTSNNATLTTTSSAASTTADHYDFGFGVTTANAAATTASQAFTTTSITGESTSMATFKLLGYAPGGGMLEVL